MRQRISYSEWIEFKEQYPDGAKRILDWAIANNYMVGGDTYMPTVGEMIHFLIQYGNAFSHEDKLEQWVNHSLVYEDVAIGWNGSSLCDILWWECQQILRLLRG